MDKPVPDYSALIVGTELPRFRDGTRRFIRWILLALSFSALGLIDGLDSLLTASGRSGQYRGNSGSIVLWYLIRWDLWIPFVPVIGWIGKRFRFDGRTWYRTACGYLLSGVALSSLQTILLVVVSFITIYDLRSLPAFLANRPYVLLSTFITGVAVYGLVLAFSVAWDYYSHYRSGELKSSLLETQLAQAQTHALKMQLHPHFLFNTLNSISALQLEDVAAAQRMMARLGDFLRMTLEDNGTQVVALKKEIEFLNCYLEIERMRFGTRLTTSVRVEPQLLDVNVPTLILQPIVENSIRHGVSDQIKPATIEIVVKRENGSLLMIVHDNGSGVPTDSFGECAFVDGVGLSNTRRRLAHLYGHEAKLIFENSSEGGFEVKIDIPLDAQAARTRK
jgi:two-component system, LytTR family, sensor kinase